MPLLKWSRPSTISGFIVPISVDSVKRRSGGTFSHVLKERRKVVHPAVADVNSATAIKLPAVVRWVVAARLHRFPRFVGASWGSSSILRAVSVLLGVGVPAPSNLRASLALSRVFARQRRPANGYLRSAVALDSPMFELGDMVRKAENGQTPKTSVCQIDWSHMMIISYEIGGV